MIPNYKQSCYKLKLMMGTTSHSDILPAFKNYCCMFCREPVGIELGLLDTQITCAKCRIEISCTRHMGDAEPTLHQIMYRGNVVRYDYYAHQLYVGRGFGAYGDRKKYITINMNFDLQQLLNQLNILHLQKKI